jgi:hypothetical protein
VSRAAMPAIVRGASGSSLSEEQSGAATCSAQGRCGQRGAVMLVPAEEQVSPGSGLGAGLLCEAEVTALIGG